MYKFILCFFVVFGIKKIKCDFYDDSKLEKIDFDAIRSNERLLQSHFNCIIDGEGCTPATEELRKNMPEIMATCCAKCSDKHREEANKMTNYLIGNKPDLVSRLLDKFDPDRKYRDQCAEKLKAEGVDLSNF